MPHNKSLSKTDMLTPLSIAVLTVSDTRSFATDTSGQLLMSRLKDDGHLLGDRKLVKDDIYQRQQCQKL